MFASLGVVLVVIVVVTFWQRATRRGRVAWLTRLALPGQWQSTDGSRIEFAGGLDHGDYEWRRAGVSERGDWRYVGHTLELLPVEGAARSFDVRLFEAGKLSLTPARGDALLLEKQPSNVVPLFRGRQ